MRRLERINVEPGVSKPLVRYCTCSYPGSRPNLVISPSGFSEESWKALKS
jgi:hypothetical protein